MRTSRRSLLRLFGSAGLALPLAQLAGSKVSRAEGGVAKRVIFFYFPDGIAGVSQNGEPSLWHATGNGSSFTLGELQEPLAPFKDQCVFLNGLSLGPTDSGSHPGGAKKLLTATDGGNGKSIDQLLADTVGADAAFRHLYLGAHATANNASGDKYVSYAGPGQSVAPQDDPRSAFSLLFDDAPPPRDPSGEPTAPDPVEVSVIDGVLDDVNTLRARLGDVEKSKLDLHLESLREVEKRIKEPGTVTPLDPTCDAPALDTTGVEDGTLLDPTHFPDVLRSQIDLMVLAMACGLTRVGVVQASQHTSELLMSKFPNTPMFDPSFDMRSHQASHYGASHDPTKKEFSAFVKQCKWWVSQFAYLLGELASRPEGDGTMLDHSMVLLCSEVCDGNTHFHDDMPFVLAGGAGGRIPTGRLLNTGGRRHADLFIAMAQAMGLDLQSFGDANGGALPGLLA
jgi:hypothetical protein